jgi:hypothetical protein
MNALARISSDRKRQTHPLVKKKLLVVSLKWLVAKTN